MANAYDVVVLGAGPDGLVAAACLARAGRRILVLEAGPAIGGPAAASDFAPGFRAPVLADVASFSPDVAAELELAEHGLETSDAGGVFVPRGRLFLPAKGAPELDGPDARAFAELDGFVRKLSAALAPVFESPLPEIEPTGLAGYLELFRPGWRLRRLGKRDLAEAMRFLPMPIADVLDERFASDALKVAVAADGVAGSWLGPRSPGSAVNFLLQRLGHARGLVGHPRFARGLADALGRAATAAGAEISTATAVERILVEEGAAAGVAAGGEEVRSGAVLSTLDPRTTLLKLVGERHFTPRFVHDARAIRARGTLAVVRYGLSARPDFGAPEDAWRILGGARLDDLEQAFDDTKYGRLPRRPHLDLTLPSLWDASLADDGRHVLVARVQYPPYDLRERSWDDAREELGDLVTAAVGELAPGFAETVAARDVLTPLDLERRFGDAGGCLAQVEPALDQVLWMRPLPGWARHDTPVAGLWLGGPGTHGGGPMTGLAGRNAARRLLAGR